MQPASVTRWSKIGGAMQPHSDRLAGRREQDPAPEGDTDSGRNAASVDARAVRDWGRYAATLGPPGWEKGKIRHPKATPTRGAMQPASVPGQSEIGGAM